MYIDHFAYRVKDRKKAARFCVAELGYLIVDDFLLDFGEDILTRSFALRKKDEPDIFISQGEPGSIVYKWVGEHGNYLHHIAYRVNDVAAKMKDWCRRGVAQFTTVAPIRGEKIIQAFTYPHHLTGIIYELIQREDNAIGFEPENVIKLINSTKGL